MSEKINVPLSRAAIAMLAEMTEKATAPGAMAGTLHELYTTTREVIAANPAPVK